MRFDRVRPRTICRHSGNAAAIGRENDRRDRIEPMQKLYPVHLSFLSGDAAGRWTGATLIGSVTDLGCAVTGTKCVPFTRVCPR
jgi:hypothetical protein